MDIIEVAGACATERMLADLIDEGSLGNMARGMLIALTDPGRYKERKRKGGVHYHQLYQLSVLGGNGLKLEGTIQNLHHGRFIKGYSGDMEVSFGQGFGATQMERYMPLWFELGISGPGALVSPLGGRRAGAARELISVSSFQRESTAQLPARG